MKSSINKIPLGQIQDIFTVISKEDFILRTNFVKGSVYSVDGTDTGFLATSDSEIQRIWGEWDYTPFTMKINASDSSFTIPANPLNQYDYYVDWGDGNVTYGHTADAQHTYDSPGEYIVKIWGKFGAIHFNNSGDKTKVMDIQKWGDISWRNFSVAFRGCSNMIVSATDIPDLTKATNLFSMFRDCTSITQLDFAGWDFSTITNMSIFVSGCTSLNNVNLDGADTSNVATMASMFYNCPSLLDLKIQNLNIEKVSNFTNFANGVTIPTATYDQILTNWSAQNVNPSLNIHFGNSKYSAAGQAGRDDLINNHGWTITDGGPI